jgi:N-acetylglutamate synthase-like GNAT family acetyltransferase
MKIQIEDYQISDDKNQLQLDIVHSLLKDAYWCKGIPKKTVAAAIESSICFGVYKSNSQVGFARIVTDGATFAWICDVIIDEKHRGRGLSKELMKAILKHSKLQGLRRICLATKDAHKLYEQFNFKVTETPQNWMEIKNNNIYLG